MKKVSKLFVTALLLSLCFFGYCQDVKVNINNQEQTGKDDCPYRINGICSTEDIGGVDVELITDELNRPAIKLTNYNEFPVTVLWSIESKHSGYGTSGCIDKVGTTVVGVNGTKTINIGYSSCYIREYSLNGLIVRKLAQ